MALKKKIADRIITLLQKNPQGLSITEIITVLKLNRNTAGRYLETLLISGLVEMRPLGMAKIYKISNRLPVSAILSISAEMVVQLDSFLRIIYANEQFCTFVGIECNNLLGKNIEYTPVALVFDELFVGFLEKVREGVSGNEWSGEVEIHSKDVIVSCRIAPTVFGDGRKGVSIILEDITQRKLAERALQESEATARALINVPTDSVILMNSQGIIMDLNDTAVIRFKKHKDELIGKLADTFLPEDIARSRRKLVTQVLLKKQMVRFEDERDGNWYDTVAYPIAIESGEVTRVAIVARDITERKKAEGKIRGSNDKSE